MREEDRVLPLSRDRMEDMHARQNIVFVVSRIVDSQGRESEGKSVRQEAGGYHERPLKMEHYAHKQIEHSTEAHRHPTHVSSQKRRWHDTSDRQTDN